MNTTVIIITLAMELGLIYIRSKRPCNSSIRSSKHLSRLNA